LRMVKVQNIAEAHHVLRFLPTRVQFRDFDTNELRGVHLTAFEPRECDRGALSVTWIEYFRSFTPTAISKAISAFKAAWGSLPPQAAFAIGNVGSIKSVCKAAGNPVRIVHEPSKKNPAHAAIRRLQEAEAVIFDQLAHEAFSDIRDARGARACSNPMMGIEPPN